VAAKHRKLTGINARRAIFSGLIDAEHRRRVGAAVAWPPAFHRRVVLRLKIRISAAPPSERIAFQPAIEMPRKRNWTWSQRISGACVICFKSSAVEPSVAIDVQVVKPSKILASTPA